MAANQPRRPTPNSAPAPARPTYRIETLRSGEDGLEIPFSIGEETFALPPAAEWPDEAFEAMPEPGTDPSPRVIVTLARALLGDDYERFRAAGGRAMDVMRVLNADAAAQGLELGE